MTYRLLDQATNRARDSLILEVMVALRITPSNISIPRVTQAIAPDNTVTQGDINQSGQGRMEVWMDNVDGLQTGDTLTVVLGANTVVTAPLVYAGQPLPLRLIVTAAQILTALPGAANNNTPGSLRFRAASGGAVFDGPARDLTFNL